MKRIITILAAVALTLGLGTVSASADEPDADKGVTVTFTDYEPGAVTVNVEVDGSEPGERWVEIVKRSPRGRQIGRRVHQQYIHEGSFSKRVHFPKARRWQRVEVSVDGVKVAVRMVEMPRSQWPTVKPRPWASINTWWLNAEVWIHARQPRNTRTTPRATSYRVQVVRGGHVRTVQRGRVDGRDSDRTRIHVRERRRGPKFLTVRVKSRGKVIEQRRMQVRW